MKNGLVAAKVATLPLTDDGKTRMHGDGRGLCVLVEPGKNGITRSYNFRFTAPADGSKQIMRFGNIDELTLTEARDKALKFRALLLEGKDPRHAAENVAAGQITLKAYADQYWTDLTAGKPDDNIWKHALARFEKLHDKAIGTITLDQVFETIKPYWAERPVSAARVVQKMGKVFNHARVRKVRADNPCLLEDLKALGFEAARKLQPVVPHNALPYAELPAFLKRLSYQPEITARAVEFCILTGTRSQETREARWSWLNDDMTVITIPGEYMKGRRDHVIPLATQVTEMLRNLPRRSEWIFPSPKSLEVDAPLLPNALLAMCNRVLGLAGQDSTKTVKLHGFRSTFRDFGADKLEVAREVLEFCLAHREGSSAEKAYWRSDILDKRRGVMQAYADFATGSVPPANVVTFKQREVA